MHPVLLADIGATNSRFAVTDAHGRPQQMLAIENASVSGMAGAVTHYLAATGLRPHAAVLGIASPIEGGDHVRMTNRDWQFSLSGLAANFGWHWARAINDFEAVAWSLDVLGPDDLQPIGPDLAAGAGPKVVFGPGTGLGVAALVRTAAGPHVIATEGGHVVFGPASADEEPVFERLRAAHGYVSAETILCGPGLERLHAALHGAPLSASGVRQAAMRGDPAATATVALFVRLLGRFAGDIALTFKATGGVYLAGGVAQRMAPLIDAARFRDAYEAHPPYRALMQTIPTQLITFDQPGLLGCAVVAARMAAQPA